MRLAGHENYLVVNQIRGSFELTLFNPLQQHYKVISSVQVKTKEGRNTYHNNWELRLRGDVFRRDNIDEQTLTPVPSAKKYHLKM
jgi:hypothetical protein